MCRVVLRCNCLAKGVEVCRCDVSHVLDVRVVVVVEEFVAKRVNLPGEGLYNVGIEVLQGQL